MDINSVKIIISLVFNVLIILLTIYAHNRFVKRSEENHPERSKFYFYIYFTSDSNILSAVCSLILIPYLIMVLTGRITYVPTWVFALHFVGTCAVMVTFMTVVVFLGPVAGYDKMYKDSDLYMHMICPLLAFVSCCFLVPVSTVPSYFTFLGIIPTIVYGLVYITMVLIIGQDRGGWEDFYTFNRGGKWYISCLLMLSGSYLISLLTMYVSRVQ